MSKPALELGSLTLRINALPPSYLDQHRTSPFYLLARLQPQHTMEYFSWDTNSAANTKRKWIQHSLSFHGHCTFHSFRVCAVITFVSNGFTFASCLHQSWWLTKTIPSCAAVTALRTDKREKCRPLVSSG